MLKSQRDRLMSSLSGVDRQSMRGIIAAIKEARGGSPDLAAAQGAKTAREILEGWQVALPDEVRSALEATLVRDETGPKVGDLPPDFDLKRLGRRNGYAFPPSGAISRWPWPLAATLDRPSAPSLSA